MEICKEIEKIFREIEKQLSKKDLERFIHCDYENICLYHHTLGGWIRKEFLGADSTLNKLFVQSGIAEKDDMSMLMIELFYVYIKSKQQK